MVTSLLRTVAQFRGLNRPRDQLGKLSFANAGAKNFRKAPVKLKLALVDRVCWAPIAYRCSRWSPNCEQLAAADRLQSKLTAACLLLRMLPGEAPGDYVKRRNSQTSRITRERKWTKKWCSRVIRWDAHTHRANCPNQWSTKLVRYHDDDWLLARRLLGRHGRPGTRLAPGHPTTRWAEGVDTARIAIL